MRCLLNATMLPLGLSSPLLLVAVDSILLVRIEINHAALFPNIFRAVKFEESILSILPSSLFIISAAAQCVRLVRHKHLKVRPSLLLIAKLVRRLLQQFSFHI